MVFYGSQTGTAEEFAGRLAKDAARYGMKGMVADPEECEMVSCCVHKDREYSMENQGQNFTPLSYMISKILKTLLIIL